jgi:hypothetical protein
MVKNNTTYKQGKSVPSKNQTIVNQDLHFSGVSISNYRCFKEFSIDSLARINLIGGKNNVGKSTLLEAIFFLVGGTNISLVVKINAFRGMENYQGDSASIRDALWKHLFHNFDDNTPITIKSNLNTGKNISVVFKQVLDESTVLSTVKTSQSENINLPSQSLRLQYVNALGRSYKVDLKIGENEIVIPPSIAEPMFPGIFVTSHRTYSLKDNAIRFGQQEIKRKNSDIVDALKNIEPRLSRIATIVSATGPLLYGDIGLNQMLPLSVMGDGIGNLATILLAISSAPKGIVLIDEIDNGLHYSIMEDAWKTIADTARRNDTQIFATTHSFECIKAASKAFFNDGFSDFRYHRLQRVNESIDAVTLDESSLNTTIERGWEVR